MHIKEKINIADYRISIEIIKPEMFNACLIIANGAGGNMYSEFISHYHNLFAEQGIMTVKFNFHYQEIGKKIPDKNIKCQETYLGVLNHLTGQHKLQEEQIILGGKSMGGRIATQIAHQTNCKKIIVFGYPLHPPGEPDKLRDEHLYPLKQKVLFIQGENDAFGNKVEMETVIKKMKNAQIAIIPSGNHSLKVAKKFAVSTTEIEEQILNAVKLLV